MEISLDGKVAFITGAASGIGRATSIALAKAGARVMLVDIDVPGMEETAHAMGDDRACALVRADVGSAADVDAAVAKTIAEFGRLDCAHNNAGVFDSGPLIADYPPDQFERIMRTNVFGVFLCMQAELRHMAPRKTGAIVNTSSASGLRATPQVCAYTTSKHAVIGLTRAAAVEYGPLGIRVNAICPGMVRTPMTAVLGEEGLDAVRQMNPSRTIAEPEEMAGAVLWMFSDHARYVTGTSFSIDGGFVIG